MRFLATLVFLTSLSAQGASCPDLRGTFTCPFSYPVHTFTVTQGTEADGRTWLSFEGEGVPALPRFVEGEKLPLPRYPNSVEESRFTCANETLEYRASGSRTVAPGEVPTEFLKGDLLPTGPVVISGETRVSIRRDAEGVVISGRGSMKASDPALHAEREWPMDGLRCYPR